MIVPTMILYSKGINVKNCDSAYELYAAKLRAEDQKFRYLV